MAISFITTVGQSNSTSYVTVDEFNSYIENLPFIDETVAPSKNNNTLIKKLLNISTNIIDQEHFIGQPTNLETQALEFPRVGITNKRGYQIADNIIPKQLKDAVCELCIFLYQNQINNNKENDFDQVDNVSVQGSLSLNFTKNIYKTKLPTIVKQKLKEIGYCWEEKQAKVTR